MNPRFSLALKTAVSAGFMIALLHWIGVTNLKEILQNLLLLPLAMAVAFNLILQVLNALKLRMLLPAPRPRLAGLIRVNFITILLGAFIPGGIGGEIARWAYLSREAGSKDRALAALLLDRITGLWVQVFLSLLAWLWLGRATMAVWIAGPLALGAFGALIWATSWGYRISTHVFRAAADWYARRTGAAPHGTEALGNALLDLLAERGRLTRVLLLSIFNHLLVAATLILLDRSIGGNLGPAHALVFLFLFTVITALPVTLGTWGLSEGTMGALYLYAGSGSAKGVLISLLMRFMNLPAMALGLGWFLAGRTGARPSALETPGAPAPVSRDRLILRLNEIYHDLEGRAYEGKHPDISEEEVDRWRRLGSNWLEGDRPPARVLDIGSGTGFVPLQLIGFLRKDDTLTCCDLSAAMLAVCGENLKAAGILCPFKALKLDGDGLPLPDASQDLVTVNAVMHHLAEPETLCREIARVLKPGGRLVVGHEPTSSHHRNPILVLNYWCLLPFADWKLFGYEILLRLGLFESMRGFMGRFIPELGRHNDLLRQVNERLILEGLVDRPMAAEVLSSLLDAQSPTAGGMHYERGFSREDFARLFPGWKFVIFETYKHLNKIHPRARILRRYEDWLAKRLPNEGSSLFCGLSKPVA